MEYIVVSYNNKTKEVVNRTIKAICKAGAIVTFERVENCDGHEVLLNVIEFEKKTNLIEISNMKNK